jgi:hypothetical protein
MPRKEPVVVAHLEDALCVMVEESVVPSKERPAPIVVAATFPVASVRRSEFGSVETMSAEVEAVEAERYVEEAYVVKSWWRVEEALLMSPPPKRMSEVVAFTPLASGVKGKEETPRAESEEAPIVPVGVTVTMLLVAEPMPEMVCAEVDAVPADT